MEIPKRFKAFWLSPDDTPDNVHYEISSTVNYRSSHYWNYCRTNKGKLWAISDSVIEKLDASDMQSRIQQNSLILTFIREDEFKVKSRKIPGNLVTLVRLLDVVYRSHNVYRKTSPAEFWKSITLLGEAINKFSPEALENLALEIQQSPRVFLRLPKYITDI